MGLMAEIVRSTELLIPRELLGSGRADRLRKLCVDIFGEGLKVLVKHGEIASFTKANLDPQEPRRNVDFFITPINCLEEFPFLITTDYLKWIALRAQYPDTGVVQMVRNGALLDPETFRVKIRRKLRHLTGRYY